MTRVPFWVALNIFLRDNKYVLVGGPKEIYVATLHRRQDDTYLGQLRAIGFSSRYVHFLARRSNSGFELNFIPCDAGCNPINDLEGLNDMAADAVSHFKEKEFAEAEKIAELGR
jgi:hypothetical protein